jgi:transketolase
MVVVVPCDAFEAQKATVAAAFNNQPTYLRFGREKSPVFTTHQTPFEIGRAEIFRDGKDVAIIGCGMLVYNALVAAEELSDEGIECAVINNHTIKPLDEKTILHVAERTGAVVTVEEHQVNSGLGSAIAEFLARNHPVPQEFIGIQDSFGESGESGELLKKFGLDTESIKAAVKKVFSRKSHHEN